MVIELGSINVDLSSRHLLVVALWGFPSCLISILHFRLSADLLGPVLWNAVAVFTDPTIHVRSETVVMN